MNTASTSDLEVAIIGAGISGLAVARALRAEGRSFRIFEARPRPGGRILSARVPGGRADLGPTWFWPGERRILSLVSELGLDVHDQFATGDALYVGDHQVQRMKGFTNPPAFRFSNGAQSLVEALVDALPSDAITYDTPVDRIQQTDNHVVVHTTEETVPADAVVLALPPSLAMSAGLVEPTSLEAAIADAATQVPVWMGGITKAVAVYERAFWRDLGLSGMISAPHHVFGEIHDMSGVDGSPAMLFGFAQAAGRSVPTAEAFLEQLVALFGSDAANPVKVLALDWSAEAFTTPASGNNSDRYDLYGSPLLRTPSWDGRLHWASTETGAVAPGHLEGALEAAERTARHV